MLGDTTEKGRLSEASNQRGSSVSVVAHRYGIWPSLLLSWKRRLLEGGHEAVQTDEEIVGDLRFGTARARLRTPDRRRRILREVPTSISRALGRLRGRSRGSPLEGAREGGRRQAKRGLLPTRRAPEPTR